MSQQPYLTLQEAADRARVSKKTIRRWIKDGLPVIRFSARLQRFNADTFDAWVEDRTEIEGEPRSPDEERPGQPVRQVIERTGVSAWGNHRK